MRTADIVIDVEQADALARPVDVLVLKYAQYSYGVDRAAAARLAVDQRTLPAPATICDVRGQRCLRYGSIKDLAEQLGKALPALISGGDNRPGVT